MTFRNFPKVPFPLNDHAIPLLGFFVANKNKVSRCSGFRLFLRGEQIISRYKYPFSTDEILHGADHQNIIKNISYTQIYYMYVPHMLTYALYIEYAPPDMLHWVYYQLCNSLYRKTYEKEELFK